MKIIILILAVLLLQFSVNAQKANTAFNISLGQLLTIKECNYKDIGYILPTTEECYMLASLYMTTNVKHKTNDPIKEEVIYIQYPIADKPELIKGSTINALIIKGKIESVSFTTFGVSDTDRILTELEKKYGTTYEKNMKDAQNSLGAKYKHLKAAWTLSGLDVFYDNLISIREGMVTVSTPLGTQRIKEIEDGLRKGIKL